MKIVLITNIKNEFDKQLAAVFEREGYKVYTSNDEIPEGTSVNLYIDTTDERSEEDSFDIRTGLDERVIKELYEANVILPMSLLEKYLPLLEAGTEEYQNENDIIRKRDYVGETDCICKRLCYITSARAGINETRETTGYGYKMAKAALHNFLQITRNVLAPRGFTIRAFDPCLSGDCEAPSSKTAGEATPAQAAEAAFNYFTRRRGIERGDTNRDDELNLVLRDAFGRQRGW